MVTREQVLTALEGCIDPELGIDIVNLGLIYDVNIEPKCITVVMTLTTPGCPMVPYFQQEIPYRLKKATGVAEVKIDLTFDPPWTPEKMTAAGKKHMALMR